MIRHGSLTLTPAPFHLERTWSMGVSVIKQRSPLPGVGCSDLGANSLPATCRLIFCEPKRIACL